MSTKKLKKRPKDPKYKVGDILRIDYGTTDKHDQPEIFYAMITKIQGISYFYNYLDNWEAEYDKIDFFDNHRGITLHA